MRDKKQTINLLKKELIQFSTSLYEYHTPKNLSVTITERKRIKNRFVSFGGPHWSASIEFPEKDELLISYFSPLKKPKFIKIQHIKEITFSYFFD